MGVIFSSAIIHMKQALERSMFRYCLFLSPLCNAFLLGMMFSEKNNQEFTLYAILGTSLSSFWTIICFSSAADISREKHLGTLSILFIAPVGFKKIMLGKLLGNSIWGLLAFLLNVFFVSILFGRFLNVNNYILLLFFLVMAVVTFVSIGMLMCSLFTLSRSAQLLMNIIEYPLLMCTGMIFPLEVLSEKIKWISYILSPTWIMEGFRLSVYGGNTREIMVVILMVVSLTIINFIIGYLMFRVIDIKTRINGTLEVY